VCDFDRGLTYTKAEEVTTSSNVVLRANNIDLESGTLDLSELRHIADAVVIPAKKWVKLHSILICTASGSRAHLGKVAFVDHAVEAAFGGFMGQITPRASIDPRFLFHLLMSPRFKDHLSGLTGGTNINNLRLGDVAVFEFSLPPLAEQKRIVAILDEAFVEIEAAVQNSRASVAASQSLLKSMVVALVHPAGTNLESETLGQLCDIYQPKTISMAEMDDEEAFPVFGANGQIGRYYAYNHEEPELLVTCRGATCGRVNMSLPKSWITGNAMVVHPKSDRISARFLRRLFEYGFDFAPVITGSAQPQITRQSLAPSVIQFPRKISDQEAVADRIEQLVEAVQIHQGLLTKKLCKLAELKQSLLTRAFSGELTHEPLAA